jgi:hypothetical protein
VECVLIERVPQDEAVQHYFEIEIGELYEGAVALRAISSEELMTRKRYVTASPHADVDRRGSQRVPG